MNLISKTHDKFTTDKFVAKVKILHHPTTIKKIMNQLLRGSIRQTARIIDIDKDLKNGDQSLVTFQFKWTRVYSNK